MSLSRRKLKLWKGGTGCMPLEETTRHCIKETCVAVPAKRGQPARFDDE
jgi:hypothetical protein